MTTPKRALFVWGGEAFHEPREATELFAGLLQGNGFAVDIESDLNVLLDAGRLAAMDLIVICITWGQITDEQERGLLEAVKTGTGLGGWHGGLADTFRTRTEYQFAVGGQFVAHPGLFVDFTVQITDNDDPITREINDFAMHADQYCMHVDPGNEVLATTTFSGEHNPWIEGTVMPVVWKKRYGAGKVFYCSLGHTEEDLGTPQVRTIIERGLAWAAR